MDMNINTKMEVPGHKSLHVLSRLLLQTQENASGLGSELQSELLRLSRAEFDDLLALANLNHVVMRGMEAFRGIVQAAGDAVRAEWAQTALSAEQARIANAVSFLEDICAAFNDHGYDVSVIKSLDHWPVLGSVPVLDT